MRQYIGARYVPKFMGVYDATQAYDALCVVDNGMGTSYITKIPTPAGTPLTDTTYYAIYGASSGAIINLQNQIGDLNDLNTTDKDSLVDAVNENVSEIQNLASAMEKNILVIGNSYVGYGCADALMAEFNHSYVKTGSGTGFLAYIGHASDTFGILLNDAISDGAIPNDSITDVLFVSAMGDTRAYQEIGSYSTFKNQLLTAMSDCMTAISTNFTNCKRVAISFAETRKTAYFASPDYPNNYDNLFQVHRIFKEMCPRANIDYLGWSGFNSLFVGGDIASDNYHPTASGATAIGGFIKASYFGNAEYITKQSQASCTFGGQAGKTVTCVERLLPDSASVNIRTVSLDSGPINVAANSPVIDLGMLPIPVPAPEPSIDIETTMKIITDGVGTDILRFNAVLKADSYGRAIIHTPGTISGSTTGGGAAFVGLQNLTYIF